MPALIIGIALLGITITEWVFAYWQVSYAMVMALGLGLALYLGGSLISRNERFAHCLDSLALIPIYILFTSALPWFFLPQQLLLPGVYSLILALVFWHLRFRKLSPVEIGLRRGNLARYILLGVVLGIPAGAIEYSILTPTATFPDFEFKYLARDWVYMTAFVGLAEEMLFRGLIQRDLAALFGWKWGLFLSSYLFGVMHLTWRSPMELVFTFLAGLGLGYLYHKTQSLVAPVVLHGIGNTVLVGIMPYLFG